MASGPTVDAQALLSWQRGHRQANEYQEKERMATLVKLTPEQARAVFISLYRVGKALAEAGGNLDTLERLKIEHLIERRRILDRLASLNSTYD
jgi:hypothetical protein